MKEGEQSSISARVLGNQALFPLREIGLQKDPERKDCRVCLRAGWGSRASVPCPEASRPLEPKGHDSKCTGDWWRQCGWVTHEQLPTPVPLCFPALYRTLDLRPSWGEGSTSRSHVKGIA